MKFENYPISAQKMTSGSFSCVDFYVYKGLKFLRKFMSFGIHKKKKLLLFSAEIRLVSDFLR